VARSRWAAANGARWTAALLAAAVLAGALIPVVAARPAGPGSPNQNRQAPVSGCSARVTETLQPASPTLCATARVSVSLGITCPTVLPLHVVFVVGNHLAMQDDLADVKRAARQAVDALDFRAGTQVGLVTISGQARTVLDLTDRKSGAQAAINRIQLDPVNPFVRYFDWVGTAQGLLEDARDGESSPLEVIVVYSTGCPSGYESYCTRQVASAGKAKGAGMTVIGVCNPNARPFGFPLPSGHCHTLQQMATSGLYHDLAQASRVASDFEDVQRMGEALTLIEVRLDEWLTDAFDFVPGSASPAASHGSDGLTFAWQDISPGSVLTASYRISPTVMGPSPLRSADGGVSLVDSLQRGVGPVALPPRVVTVTECVRPTETPTLVPTVSPSPSATVTPRVPSPTATVPAPSATPVAQNGVRAFLPMALHSACRREDAHVDVVLAIDASSSMGQPTDQPKIEAARAAANRLVDLLDPDRDRAAVLAFDATVKEMVPLTGDRAALRSGIAGISLGAGTRLDLAMNRAATLLDASPRLTSRPAIVLLTDGLPDGGTRPEVLAAAERARSAGIVVFTVGLGADVDADLLRAVATRAENYLAAGDAAALRAAYERIAGELPCPGGAVWAGH
jgi:Mg-chelatase subunit ChlD